MENSLEAIATTIAFSSRDWSTSFDLAMIYGIVFGWGDAIEDVRDRYKWNDMFVEQLANLREDYKKRMVVALEGGKEDASQIRLQQKDNQS